jgi:glycosyltransferase involved in cell wall biosynthesis
MRVMFVTGSFPPMRCGVGDYTQRLAMALAAIPGNTVGLLTSRRCAAAEDGGNVAVFPIVDRWTLGEIWKVFRLFRRWRPDLVHIQYPTQGYGRGTLPCLVPLLAWLAGVRIVQTWHEPVARRATFAMLLQRLPPGRIVVVRPRYTELLDPLPRALVPARRLQYIPSASAIPRASLGAQQQAMLRQQYLKGQKRLVVFFGFLYRHKGVDLLFDIADPATDQVVIAGDTDHLDFKAELQQRAASPAWAGKVTLCGFMAADDVAALLAVADAVVLPFRHGGGEWNTSLHGALVNNAYVITTSTTRHGYDADSNIFYAGIDSVDQMREALALAPQRRRQSAPAVPDWRDIAAAHMGLYRAAQATSE